METKYVISFHILLILLSQTSSQKLSTFGRAKPQAPTDETADSQPKLKTFGSIGSTSTQSTNFYTRNRLRARDCSTHADCASIENTSCVKDPADARLRCLCGDNKPPINGLCKSKLKGLRHLCQELINCEDGMICAIENATKPAAFGAKVQPASQYKVCLCDEADGWVEDLRSTHCSGALNVVSGFAPILLGLFVGTLLAQKQMH